jgi:virginiamycin A acetyltransferase
MNGANHRMNSITTYPFNIFGNGWEEFTPSLDDLPLKGDTVVGNDVWIGINSTLVGKITIGNDVLIAPNSFVNFDVPDHSIVVGNPAKIIHKENATENYINNTI